MKRTACTILAFVSLFCLSQACSKTPEEVNRNDDIEEISKTIDACIGWAKEKDLDLLFSVIVNDSCYLSVHPTQRVVRGFEDFKKNVPFWMNPDFQYVRHEIRDLSINLSKSGDVAWFYCVLDDMNEWKGEPANWENTRWTGVLEKRNDRWVMVQQHFSFPSG